MRLDPSVKSQNRVRDQPRGIFEKQKSWRESVNGTIAFIVGANRIRLAFSICILTGFRKVMNILRPSLPQSGPRRRRQCRRRVYARWSIDNVIVRSRDEFNEMWIRQDDRVIHGSRGTSRVNYNRVPIIGVAYRWWMKVVTKISRPVMDVR